MYKKIIYLLTVSVMFLQLSACKTQFDIQQRSISLGVGLDYSDGEYSFVNEYANIRGAGGQSQESGQSGGGSSSLIEVEGKNINDLVDNLYRRCEGEVFLGAIRIIVFTEEYAQNGIEPFMNRIRGYKDFRQNMYITVTGDPLKDIYSYKSKNNTSVSASIDSIIKHEEDIGNSIHTYAGEILSKISLGKTGYLIPYIKKDKDTMVLSGYAIMDNNSKIIGLIPAEKRQGIVFLLGDKTKLNYYLSHKDNNFNMVANLGKKKIKAYYQNGKIKFDINMNFIFKLEYTDYNRPVTEDDMDRLNAELKDKVKKDILETIHQAQKEYNCDYLDFYLYFRASHPDEFEKMDWNKKFSEADVNVNIKSRIKAENLANLEPKK